MYNETQTELLSEVFVNRTNTITQELLLKIASRINDIGQLTATDLIQLSKLKNINQDIVEFFQELARITNLDIIDIYKIYEASAVQIYGDAEEFYKFNNVNYIPFSENTYLKQTYNAVALQTANTFINISNTTNIGFSSVVNGKVSYTSLAVKYQELVDTAITSVTSGQGVYNEEIRSIMISIADSGIRYMPKNVYESGYSRRLDSSVRQTVLDGIKAVNTAVQEQVGEEFGSDGVELTAHTPCAVDHLPYQGKQYSNEEFEEVQNDLERKISTWNCRHSIRRIVLGISKPIYSEEELDKMKEESDEIFEFDGKEYSRYEGTQLQRKIETAIREQKEATILYQAYGDTELAQEAQAKIDQLSLKYKDLSNISGLPTKLTRLTVSGYTRIATN